MRLLVAAAASLLVTVWACRPLTEPTDHLRLSVAVDRAEVSPGVPATIRVRLENGLVTGARTARLHGSGTCTFGFEVRDTRGNVVAPTRRGCTDDLREWPVEPGQHVERVFSWDGRASEGGAERVPPGTYALVGVLESREVELESAPVGILVRGAR